MNPFLLGLILGALIPTALVALGRWMRENGNFKPLNCPLCGKSS